MISKKIACSIILVFASYLTGYSQLDFDSLYQHNSEFKSKVDGLSNQLSIFDKEKTLNVTIQSDFKSFIKNKNKDEYQPAVFRVIVSDSIVVTRNIKIKARGNFRRKTCYYPPIMLNFKKKDMLMDELQQFDKMKLVGTCRKNQLYSQMLINEYLIYKAYNLLTENSFRVRLLNVTYIDESGKIKPRTVPSFIIEPAKEMAERLDASEYRNEGITDGLINKAASDRLAIFQYMIGNTDWSVSGLHNVKLLAIKTSSEGGFFPVGYDFDYCGLVNAPYAQPPEMLGINSVRERLFRGFCRTEDEYQKALEEFLIKQDEILDLWEGPLLPEGKYKNSCLDYLNEFFVTMQDNSLFRKEFINKCR